MYMRLKFDVILCNLFTMPLSNGFRNSCSRFYHLFEKLFGRKNRKFVNAVIIWSVETYRPMHLLRQTSFLIAGCRRQVSKRKIF